MNPCLVPRTIVQPGPVSIKSRNTKILQSALCLLVLNHSFGIFAQLAVQDPTSASTRYFTGRADMRGLLNTYTWCTYMCTCACVHTHTCTQPCMRTLAHQNLRGKATVAFVAAVTLAIALAGGGRGYTPVLCSNLSYQLLTLGSVSFAPCRSSRLHRNSSQSFKMKLIGR